MRAPHSWRKRPSVTELRAALYDRLGPATAREFIAAEARIARLDPASDAAVRHAFATYNCTPDNLPLSVATQEGLLP